MPDPGGIDWLRDPANDPTYVFTTYGRVPALEVIIDSTAVSGFEVLSELAAAVSHLPVEGRCLSVTDVVDPTVEE